MKGIDMGTKKKEKNIIKFNMTSTTAKKKKKTGSSAWKLDFMY